MNAPDRARAKAGITPRPTRAQTVAHYQKLGRDAEVLKVRTVTRVRLAEAAEARTQERGSR